MRGEKDELWAFEIKQCTIAMGGGGGGGVLMIRPLDAICQSVSGTILRLTCDDPGSMLHLIGLVWARHL